MTAGRHRLGSWKFPSGNNVDVYLEPAGAGPARHLSFEWDDPPPLRAWDERFYALVVLPKVVRLAREYLEKPGPVVVVRVERSEAS